MAQTGFLEALLGGLPADTKRVLTEAFRYVIPNGRFGPPEHQTKSESFNAFYVSSTTPATSTETLSLQHGMGRTPYLAVGVLPLNTVGAQLPRLTVARAADAQRVYFTSADTSAPFTVFLE